MKWSGRGRDPRKTHSFLHEALALAYGMIFFIFFFIQCEENIWNNVVRTFENLSCRVIYVTTEKILKARFFVCEIRKRKRTNKMFNVNFVRYHDVTIFHRHTDRTQNIVIVLEKKTRRFSLFFQCFQTYKPFPITIFYI